MCSNLAAAEPSTRESPWHPELRVPSGPALIADQFRRGEDDENDSEAAVGFKAFASSLGGSLLLLSAATVMAQTPSCTVTITSPAPNTTVSGTVTVGVTDTCTAGSFSFNRLYVGTIPTPPILPCPSPGECVQFSAASAAVQWNTSALPNGIYYLNVAAWNSTGLIREGGTNQGIQVTVANANGAPDPSFTVNSTPAPTPGPSGCSVAIASPTIGASLSRTVTVSVTENCPGFAFNRLYVGTVPAPPVNPCPSPGECVQFPAGSATVQFDTTRLSDGVWYLNVGVWNETGLVQQGHTPQGMQVTIANGSSGPTPPPPSPTSIQTSTAVPSPLPTIAATTAPTPFPIFTGVTTVDPNANQTTKNVLAYLYSLMGSGPTHHLIQSNQNVAVFCTAAYGPGNCPSQDSTNYAADGNVYTGAIGVDPCNGFWANYGGSYNWLGSPACQTGPSSDTETEATHAWNNGQLVVMSIEMTNPFNNWQNQAPGSAQGIACPGQAGNYIALGASIDCSGINSPFANNMLRPATTENAHWLAELQPYAQMMLRLQAAGVTVIYRVFQEINTSGFWWGSFPSNLHGPLIVSIERYFESHGVHNALYEYAIIDGGGTFDYPGNANVDLLGTDVYASVPGTGATPGYTALSSLGSGKPITFAEYNCSTALGGDPCTSQYNYDNIDQAAQSSMPNLVLVNYWIGNNPGNATYPPTHGANPLWLGYMQHSYNIMKQNLPNFSAVSQGK